MRATVMYGAGDVRVQQFPDSAIKRPTDALVRVRPRTLDPPSLGDAATRNAIPAVIAARPGIVTYADLPTQASRHVPA